MNIISDALSSWVSRERMEFMCVAFLCREMPFLLYCLWFRAIQGNDAFNKYRIQGDKNPDVSLVFKAARKVLIDHSIVQLPVLWYSYDFFIFLGCPQLRDPLPPLISILIEGASFIVICDTLTYWSHRLLHHPLLYAPIHKQHHEFHTNHPLASAYFSFLDDLLTGVGPTLAGPVLFRSHVLVTFGWLVIRICETTEAHFGYSKIFPFPYPFSSVCEIFRPSDWHDFHHSHNVGNYAPFFTFWDRLCGTDQGYDKHCQRKKRKTS